MRAVIGTVTLNDAIGQKRGEIEARVQEEMQRILDQYQAGVTLRGVAVRTPLLPADDVAAYLQSQGNAGRRPALTRPETALGRLLPRQR